MFKLKLSNGGYCLIDEEDYDRVSKYRWRVHRTRDHYIVTGNYPDLIYLHKFIMQTNEIVDHVYHDTLDNRKENLRIATHSQNQQNRKGANSNSKTGIRGVSFVKRDQIYRAQVVVNYVQVWSGGFKTLKEAEKAVLEARLKYMSHSDMKKRSC